MSFSDLFEKVKEKTNFIYEKIHDFVSNNVILSLCITGGVMVLLVILLLLIALTSNGSKQKKNIISDEIIFSEEMLIPQSVSNAEKYLPSRETKPRWQDDEINNWFTKPGEKELDDLSRSNDRLIEEITGVAP